MPNTAHSRLARIEEGVKYIKEAVAPLVEKSQEHEVQIQLLKNDSRWRKTILFSLAAIFGTLGGIAVEFFKH